MNLDADKLAALKKTYKRTKAALDKTHHKPECAIDSDATGTEECTLGREDIRALLTATAAQIKAAGLPLVEPKTEMSREDVPLEDAPSRNSSKRSDESVSYLNGSARSSKRSAEIFSTSLAQDGLVPASHLEELKNELIRAQADLVKQHDHHCGEMDELKTRNSELTRSLSDLNERRSGYTDVIKPGLGMSSDEGQQPYVKRAVRTQNATAPCLSDESVSSSMNSHFRRGIEHDVTGITDIDPSLMTADLEHAHDARLAEHELEHAVNARLATVQIYADSDYDLPENDPADSSHCETSSGSPTKRGAGPPGPRSHVMIRTPAAPLNPPSAKANCANHRRMFRVIRNGHGLLYRDARIDVTVDALRRPRCLLVESESKVPASLEEDFCVDVDLHIQARQHNSTARFSKIHVRCDDIDVSALAYEVLPCLCLDICAIAKQTIRIELVEFFCGRPAVTVEAVISQEKNQPRLSNQFISDRRDVLKAPPETQHICKFLLPVCVTTFLRPMYPPCDWDFADIWRDTANLETVQLQVDDGPPTNSGLASFASALTCCGALATFATRDGGLGLCGELPAHGCLPDTLFVMAHIGTYSIGIWRVAARSPERRLAEGLAAALASHLKCLPDVR